MNYSFDKQHAILYGVDEAIMLHNMIFWIEKNRANNKHFYEGRHWTYNSVRAFKELFIFWTDKQLRRIIESLVNQNIIMRGNFNKTNMDRTGWYALVNEDALLGIYDFTEKANGIADKGEPLPYSKQDIKPLPEGKDGLLPFYKDVEVKKKLFIAPKIEEIELYFECDKKLAKKFFNHYTSNGWMVGKNRMKNWHAAANNWIDGNEEKIKEITETTKSKAILSNLDKYKNA